MINFEAISIPLLHQVIFAKYCPIQQVLSIMFNNYFNHYYHLWQSGSYPFYRHVKHHTMFSSFHMTILSVVLDKFWYFQKPSWIITFNYLLFMCLMLTCNVIFLFNNTIKKSLHNNVAVLPTQVLHLYIPLKNNASFYFKNRRSTPYNKSLKPNRN